MDQTYQKIISEIIQKLWAMNEQWESYVLDEEKAGEDELIKQIRLLYRILRQELKEGDEKVRELLKKEKLKKETIDVLIEKTKHRLEFYMAFSFLRELEHKDQTALKGLLSGIYQKYIVRYEPGYLRRISDGKYDEDILEDIANRIEYLSNYYISRSYTMQGMLRDLQDETGLSAENCEYWADLIDRNYQDLKMNYILDELREIRRKVMS